MCSHNYPLIAQLAPEQAVRFLIEAPMVVKQLAPMSWNYVSAPQDGTIWLEWMSPRQNNGRFATDGYVWNDPEQAFRMSVNGFTVEMLSHTAGFRPGIDHMTSHARRRYHLVDKAPNINAPAPDPSLWIVHYHQAKHSDTMPAIQLPVSEYTKHLMNERRWIESLGRIELHTFMLHDRDHWPRVPVPSGQMHQQAMYSHGTPQTQGMMNRYQPFPNTGPPSAKRQRTHGPGPMMGPGEAMMNDAALEEEEISAFDYFDALTPRDISKERYKQHQQWMEEIFSSPYATNDIVPVDLGLGLMGELKGLTDGIVDETTIDSLLSTTKGQLSERTKVEAVFTKLKQEQFDEFGSRVQKFLDEGTAEIERMKAEHDSKMRQWQKTHQLTESERRLRVADWKDHASSVFTVVTEANGHPSDQKTNSVEEIIGQVEGLVGQKTKTHRGVTLVDKGGLEEQRPVERNNTLLNGDTASKAPTTDGMSFLDSPAGVNTARSGVTAEAGADSTGQNSAQPYHATQNQTEPSGGATGVDDMDMGLLQDGDMDIDAGDLNFELDDLAARDDEGVDVADNDEQEGDIAVGGAAPGQSKAAGPSTTSAEQGDTATPGVDVHGGDMFDESGFDFTNGTADDDGLIDFESGGMDDSAFGDALHGMDDAAAEEQA